MDPRNREAFLMGNNILKTADPSTRSSIELLKRGMFYHPDFWKFPEMIGFNYYYTLDEPELAGKYYEMASGLHSVSDPLPGQSGSGKSPAPYVASLSGKFYEESGKYREALRILKKFYQTTQDKQLKKSFMDSYKQVLKRISFRNQYVHKHLDIIGRCIQLQTGGF